jgi:hypothetical protein
MPRRKKPSNRLLTDRERKVLLNRAKGMTLHDSAVLAGYSNTKGAHKAASEALARVQRKAPDLFKRHMLDDDTYVSKHLIPLLCAEEERVFCSNGQIVYSKPVPALAIRARMIELLADLKGLRTKGLESGKTPVTVVVLNASHRAPKTINVTPKEQ